MNVMSDNTQPIPSGPRRSAIARAGALLAFTILLAVGVALSVGHFRDPLQNMLAARQWRSASCEIVSSSLANPNADGSTYRVDTTYRYLVDNRNYVGDRYQFVRAASTGYTRKAAIVSRLKPGTRTACWVNPANPDDAVIERGLTAELWYIFVPMVFVVISGAGAYFVVWRGAHSLKERSGGTGRML